MSKVQQTARLHESSVQRVARGEVLPMKQRHHTTSTRGQRWGIVVNPLVLSVAKRIRRPGTAIRIINEGAVLIINKKE